MRRQEHRPCSQGGASGHTAGQYHRRMAGEPSLLGNDQGSLLPMAAVGFVVLAAIVGGGVDLSRAYKAENRLQAACDAAVLAGRRAVTVNGFDSAAAAEASAYFDNNFDPDQQGSRDVVFDADSEDNGNAVTATATANVETTIMSVFGYDTIPVSVTCSASMGVGNSDVIMVLDTTGSMGWTLERNGPTKLSMLQDAMKAFYDTVATSTSGLASRRRRSALASISRPSASICATTSSSSCRSSACA